MSPRPVRPILALACLVILGACGSDDGAPADLTEINVVTPGQGLSGIAVVDYTINCLGDTDNAASLPDEVTIEGNLEVVNSLTGSHGPIPPEFGTPRPRPDVEIWQGFIDLPPGPCTAQLRARDNDGEVFCTATEPFTVTAETPTKINLVLICDICFPAPVGTLDEDATFSSHVGNFCPDLLALSCDELDLLEASTACEVRFHDGDNTCGPACDPQTCTPTAEGLICTPGPDPGVATTITCTDALLDCSGDGTPDPSCVIDANSANTFPEFIEASFFVACIPPEPGATFGTTITCTAVTSDGDFDCDKTNVINIDCPDPDL